VSRGAVSGALLALLMLGAVDLAVRRASLDATSRAASAFLEGYEARTTSGARQGDGQAVLRLPGLWAGSRVRLRLWLAARHGPRRVRVFANEAQVADAEIDDGPRALDLEAVASSRGEIAVRIRGGRREETVYRLSLVEVHQDGPRAIPWPRLLQYPALGALLGLLASRALRDRGRILAATAVPLCAFAAVLAVARLPALRALAVLLFVSAVAVAVTAVSDGLARLWGMPRWAAWPALALALLRVAAVSDLQFGSIDAEWHTHNLHEFAGAGRIVESQAPGISRAPYPPAFYAAVAPFRAYDYWSDVRIVRRAMALCEGAMPFLVFGIATALGLGARGGGMAALLCACLPESVLVLEKGIGANILGQLATLLCVLAFARAETNTLVRCAALALLFLSHAPAAVLGVLLLLLWWVLATWTGTLARRDLGRRLALVGLAGLTAWIAYYREVGFTFGDPNRAEVAARYFQPHVYRLGKIAQDLVLKFGAVPVVLAVLAWPGALSLPALRPLAQAWLAVTLGFAALAVLSPFPLRFEYFAVPLVCLLGGVYAEKDARAFAWCVAASGVALAVQILEGVAWRLGRFEIIAVIMESPRWPFPFRWGG
jgi:hypothetical protein